MASEAIDVLAVMGDAAYELHNYKPGAPQPMAEARAAVAELAKAASQAKSAMDSIWGTKGRDDDFIYDEMGSELSAAYFALRDALANIAEAR